MRCSSSRMLPGQYRSDVSSRGQPFALTDTLDSVSCIFSAGTIKIVMILKVFLFLSKHKSSIDSQNSSAWFYLSTYFNISHWCLSRYMIKRCDQNASYNAYLRNDFHRHYFRLICSNLIAMRNCAYYCSDVKTGIEMWEDQICNRYSFFRNYSFFKLMLVKKSSACLYIKRVRQWCLSQTEFCSKKYS